MTPRRGERGALGGGEVLPLGFLLLVIALLAITNAWAVIDARMAVSSASREATRAAVETEQDPAGAAVAAAARTVSAFGYEAGAVEVVVEAPTGFGRCAPVRVTVRHRVPAFSLPGIGGIGDVTVSASHQEIVDPYRNDVPEGTC